MNRWELTEEVKEKYKPIIQEFLLKMETLSAKDIEGMSGEEFLIRLSDTELNPYTLIKLLEEFGYEEEDIDTNGWEMDFWITLRRSGISFLSTCEVLTIRGCGITFELKLGVKEFM